jgi:branched-chain amino acid transport system substrate-binding protein
MRTPSRTLALLIPPLLLAGCGGRAPVPQVLIGHVATLSGPDRGPGEDAARGIRLAVKEADRDTKPALEVLHVDARGQAEAFEAEAVRLLAVNRVSALLGGTTAEEVVALDRGRALAGAPVPLVTFSGLSSRGLSQQVFLTGLTPSAQGKALARAAAQRLGQPIARAAAALAAPGPIAAAVVAGDGFPVVVVLVDERREEFVQVAEAFVRERGAGRPGLAPWRYGKDADFAALAGRAAAEHPAGVLIAGEAEAVRQVRGHLAGVPVFFGGGPEAAAALAAHRDTADGIYFVTPFVQGADPPAARKFVEQYRAAFHEEPGGAAAVAYEGTRLLAEAVRQAEGSPTAARLRDNLAGLRNFPGLCGPLSFDADRVLRRPAFVVGLDHGRAVTVLRCDPPAEGPAR